MNSLIAWRASARKVASLFARLEIRDVGRPDAVKAPLRGDVNCRATRFAVTGAGCPDFDAAL